MIRAVEKVRERMLRATQALEKAGVPYAVCGGNAVAAWVSTVDEAGVRNTRDVDILLRRSDLDNAKVALGAAGFVHHFSFGVDMFLDGPDATPRDAVHVVFAGEKVKPHDEFATPEVTDSETTPSFRVTSLEALVRMKLTAFRDQDRTHIRDFMVVGLVNAEWLKKLPPSLAARLKQLLDTPGG